MIIWNELFGWCSILAGIALGLYMGAMFRREDWLGGYDSFPRRMMRLAHIALIAIGMLNVQFAQTLPGSHLSESLAQAASIAMMVSAVLMPACCLRMAFRRSHYEIFAAPVISLAVAVGLTIGGLVP